MDLTFCTDALCLLGWVMLGYGILTGALFKYIRLIDEIVFSFSEDLLSFRNKLILFCLFITYIAIKSGNQWAIGGTIGLTTIIVKVYLDHRQNSIHMKGNGNHKPSKFEQWDQRYGLIQLGKLIWTTLKNVWQKVVGKRKK